MLTTYENRDDFRKMSWGMLSVALFVFLWGLFVCYYDVWKPLINNATLQEFILRIHGQNPSSFTLRMLVVGFLIPAVLTYSPIRPIEERKKSQMLQLGLGGISAYILLGIADKYFNLNYLGVFFTVISYAVGFFGFLEWRRKLAVDLKEDRRQETESQFDQMRDKVETEYSVNIPYKYQYLGEIFTSWINLINPFRGILIGGTPGSGKSFAILEEIMRQFTAKFFTGVVYDFKFPTLTNKQFNYLNWYASSYPIRPKFYVINFDDPIYSHRCNPISVDSLTTISDAEENTKVLMMNINKTWIQKEGDFFVDSANLFTAILMWYLKILTKKYDYNVCSFPHLVALSTFESRELLFLLFQQYRDLKAKMTPFNDAIENGALEQLAGQVASAGVALAKISSPELDYILTGDDFSFDLNNPLAPKILCLGNNPDRQTTYSAPLGLMLSKLTKTLNRQKQAPSMYIVDEFPTIYIRGVDNLIGTGRSNKISTVLGFQTLAQVVADYGKETADKIIRLCGSRIMGQMMDEDAKLISETIGKQKVLNRSYNYSSSDVSENQQVAMEDIVPSYRISQFSQGTFCGVTADEFDKKEPNKVFYGDVAPPLELKKHDEDIPLPEIYDFKPDDLEKLTTDYLKEHQKYLNDIKEVLCKLTFGEWIDILESTTTEAGLDEYLVNYRNLDYLETKSFTEFIHFKKNFQIELRKQVEVNKKIDSEKMAGRFSLEFLSNKMMDWVRYGFIEKNKKEFLLNHQKEIYNDVYRIVVMEFINLDMIGIIKSKFSSNQYSKFEQFFRRISKTDQFDDEKIKKDYEYLADKLDPNKENEELNEAG